MALVQSSLPGNEPRRRILLPETILAHKPHLISRPGAIFFRSWHNTAGRLTIFGVRLLPSLHSLTYNSGSELSRDLLTRKDLPGNRAMIKQQTSKKPRVPKLQAKVADSSGNGARTAPNKAQPPKTAKAEATLGGLTCERLHELLYQMIYIRRFEEKAEEGYKIGQIGGFLHLVIGQEAVCVGALAALRPDDYVIGSYREHGHAIAKGIPGDEVMAELYGKASGISGGKGGSMHIFDASRNFLGGHGIVGGQIPLGTGAAFATKYKGTDQVTLCFMGEAAVNQGAFHESLNMAQLWKLPVIYICENNRYGMGTSIQRAMSQTDVAAKADAYGMARETVNGMDLIAVYEALQRAVKRARENYEPTLLDVLTYRFKGHSIADPDNSGRSTYRALDEIEKYRKDDPIKIFAAQLQKAKLLTDDEMKEMDTRARAEVAQAVKFANDSPLPDAAELAAHVYANPL